MWPCKREHLSVRWTGRDGAGRLILGLAFHVGQDHWAVGVDSTKAEACDGQKAGLRPKGRAPTPSSQAETRKSSGQA